MARRRNRRWIRKPKADMGWMVGSASMLLVHPGGGGPGTNGGQLFGFNDIDDDILIAQDKSDWFIKRLLIDFYPVIGRASLTTAPARIYQAAVGTMSDNDATFWINNEEVIYDGSTFDHWRRLFRSWTRPVYSTWQPSLNAASLRTTTSSADANAVVSDPWGPSSIHEDMSVSNAGLVADSGVYFFLTTTPGPGSYDWTINDQLNGYLYFKCLLQKRRTA